MNDNRIKTEIFQKNRGVSGENFGPMMCYSCNQIKNYTVDIVGNTPLGELINVGTVEVMDKCGSPREVPATEAVCETCLEDLLEAKRLEEQE